MERSRRVGVRSIYARNNEDGEQDKASNHEDSAGEKSPVVGGAPRTTSSPRTTRSGGRGETGTPSPSKRTSISDDTTTSKKRPADSNLSPPFKRGRGRPPASARAAAPPTLLTEGIPKEEHDGEEERYDAVVASPTRTRRGNAAAAPPVFHEQPILDVQDDGQEQMINHTIDEHMQDDLMHEDAPPPSLDLCGRSEGDESSSYMGGSRAGLLGGALARRGRPINSTSRKNFPQKGAQRGRDQEAESSAAMIEDQSMMEEELMEEDSMMESRSDRGGSRAPHNLYNQHRESHRYLFNPDILSDFYEPDMIVTEMGDKFLKAREGTLPSLLKREMILSLIVNDTDRAESNDWVNSHPPAIPPLTANVATYICFVDTKTIEDAKLLTTDGLSPWSSSHPIAHTNMTPTRPKVRKWAVYMRGGEYCISGEDWRMSLYVLVEYSALLPRAPRLRKRVYYMTRDRTLLGLAMLIYDYIEPGPIPNIVAHGSTRMYARQRLEMVRFTDEEGNRSLLNIPVSQERPRLSMALLDPSELYDDDFSDVDNMDFVGGGMEEFDPQDGPFMGELVQSASRMPDNFVRVTKGNWTSDKTLLLKYLINETGSIPPFAVNSSKPAQPPLISSVGCFATFLKGSQVVNHATINADSLSPWTNANIRPKTRKIAMEQTESGEYIVSRKDWRTSNIVLMEMCTTLARCPRLRKRIYYVMRNNLTILGYILFMYEYTSEGDPPEIQANMKGAQFSRTPIGGRPRPAKFYSGGSGGKSMDDGMEDMNIDVMEVGDEVEVDLIEDDDTGAEELDMVEDDGMDEDDQREWYTYEGTDPNLEVFEGAVRSTVMGDRYIVCRTRRLIGDKNLVLRYCVNDLQFAYDRGIVLASKPFMPPVTSTCGIYVFFVSAENVDLRQVNKDGLSPWSVSDPQELGGKQMRTKVKKYGLERDADPPMKDPNMHHDGLKDFRIVPGKDWHTSEVVLVMLHSTLPRCPRLQKKVFYVLDTREQSVLGHVMIVYEYTEPGEPPRQADRPRRTMRRREETEFEIENVEDDGEIDKDSPFDFAASAPSRDQCIYVPLMDPAFLMDRNRQLHYCVNRGYMLERNGLLNHTVPLFPPLIGEKGDFVYFVSGADMDPRNLTCDGMAPWSDSRLPQATRPKSRKLPVEKSRDGVLRYVGGTRWEQTAYFLVVYYAVLPRCPRLKKRIIYACNSSNEIIGNIMIIYSYTEEGAIPQQVPHGNATTVMQPFYRMPPSLRDEAKRLLLDKRPAGEVATVLNDRSPSVTSRAIYNISKSMRPPSHRRMHMYKDEFVHPEWYDDAGEDPTRAAARIMHPPRRDPNRSHGLLPRNPVDGDIAPGQGVHKPAPRFSAAADSLLRRKRAAGGGGTADDYDGYAYDESGEPYIDVVADASIEVGHSEEIASTPAPGRRGRAMIGRAGGMASRHVEAKRRQRIMEFIQSQAGLHGEEDTLDYLWRMVVERNERKVLDNIRRDFGVEIVTNDEAYEEEVAEGQEEGVHHVEGEAVENDGQVDGDTSLVVVDVGGGEGVVEETVEETQEDDERDDEEKKPPVDS